MEYLCRVGTASGEVVERTFSAMSEMALRAELERQGMYLLSARRGISFEALRIRTRRVEPALLLVLSQDLAALLKAGLPLFQSLDIMLERQKDPLFRRSLATVREKVKGGVALSDAFRQEGDLSRAAGTRPSLALDGYAGTYGGPMYGDATVTADSGRLVLRFLPAPDFVGDLTHLHHDVFRVTWRHAFPWFGDGTVQFVLGADGKAAGMKVDVPNGDFWFTELEFRREP